MLFISLHVLKNGCEKEYREQREKERQRETASAEGWFCFRNWNVSRLDFYFQFTFQIQLPKLFDLSPCLLTRKRTLGLLSWELGAHVERLARIHILAKFSHTKGPAREKRKDESGSRRDFKGRAAAPGPAQAPPSADIRRSSRARAAFRRGSPARVPGRRVGGGGLAAEGRGGPREGRRGCATRRQPEAGPHANFKSPEKFSERKEKNLTSSPLGERSWGSGLHSSSHIHSTPFWGPFQTYRWFLCAGAKGSPSRSRAARACGRALSSHYAPVRPPRIPVAIAPACLLSLWAPSGREPWPASGQRVCWPCPQMVGLGMALLAGPGRTWPLGQESIGPVPSPPPERCGRGGRPGRQEHPGRAREKPPEGSGGGGRAGAAGSVGGPGRLRGATDANRRRPRGSPASAGGRIWERLFTVPRVLC